MKQIGQVPSEVRLVPVEPIPDNLFVCSAKIKLEAGRALKSAFNTGIGLPRNLETAHNEHLFYAYGLGEKGLYWEAGPSADFTEILYIFSTDSLEEAQKLMHDDPFYKEGIFYDDWWFQFAIHSPSWKMNLPDREWVEEDLRNFGILPSYPPGVKPQIREIKVELITPPRLFASFTEEKDPEYERKLIRDTKAGKPVPAFLIQHVFYRLGPGGTGQMGFDWESGPSIDTRYDLSIYSVDSIQTAKLLRENDPLNKHGIYYDCTYFEWCIHMPFRKASPTHKEALERFLNGAGVKLAK